MADFGGTDAHSLKNALDSVFNDTGNVSLADYETKLVSTTSDGANVNLGVYNGALTVVSYCTMCESSARAYHEGHNFSK